ncbi:autophagy-related protein 9A-like isoform X2 [Branchiostoma floridae x Branchiostoma japonicum]
MAQLETSYRRLDSFYDEEMDSPPNERELLVHAVDSNKAHRWNHIENLDDFFTRVYQYHQRHGFLCMMLAEILELLQFIFVLLFTTFLLQCVHYDVLFGDKNPHPDRKVTLPEALVPLDQCASSLDSRIVVCLVLASFFWFLRFIKVVYNFFRYWEIRNFYTQALKISHNDLPNMTWHEVQRCLRQVQVEQQMCIHKQELTELDIYHRILRFKNYTVAMVNKSLLPLKFQLPGMGELVFLTNGLKYNLEMILFWGPWSPFANNWHLKEDYKKSSKRVELANKLSRHILWVGIANLLLCPFILMWQILYSFFTYAEVLKRQPGSLGARKWSLYGRLYLRHFNELDHELNARLTRAYKPAERYMSSFTSHVMTLIARHVAFLAGAIFAVLVVLTIYDEDVLTIEHVLTITTLMGVLVAGCRALIPDENMVFCPEQLMVCILAQIHYMPDRWKGQAHTYRVRDEFSQLFQYKAVFLLEELLSPIITPLILIFSLRSKALDIVDFFRNFTVDVVGVGDVCSFAQMDIKRHGNPQWTGEKQQADVSQYHQAEDGKTELSLMHFTLTNPTWQPPRHCNKFINHLKEQAHKDVNMLNSAVMVDNPFFQSLQSLSSAGYPSMMTSLMVGRLGPDATLVPPRDPSGGAEPLQHGNVQPGGTAPVRYGLVRGDISSVEGPIKAPNTGLLGSSTAGPRGTASVQHTLPTTPEPVSLQETMAPTELMVAEMSFSALYMHQLHQTQTHHDHQEQEAQRAWRQPTSPAFYGTTIPANQQRPSPGDVEDSRTSEAGQWHSVGSTTMPGIDEAPSEETNTLSYTPPNV